MKSNGNQINPLEIELKPLLAKMGCCTVGVCLANRARFTTLRTAVLPAPALAHGTPKRESVEYAETHFACPSRASRDEAWQTLCGAAGSIRCIRT